MVYSFNMNDFLRSLPHENADYVAVLKQTQAFNEFISERERTASAPSSASGFAMSPLLASITLFDSIILSKRDRGRFRTPIPSLTLNRNPFSRHTWSSALAADFLSDTSDHLWRTASASNMSDNENFRTEYGEGRDYRSVTTRVPAKLDESLMREPSMIQGVPQATGKTKSRKPVALSIRQRMNGLSMHAPNGLPSPIFH